MLVQEENFPSCLALEPWKSWVTTQSYRQHQHETLAKRIYMSNAFLVNWEDEMSQGMLIQRLRL